MLRRSFLAASTALLTLPVATRRGLAAAPDAERHALHVLDRLAFGPSEADVGRIRELGSERYIDAQLAPESLPEPPALTERLATLGTLKLDPVQLFREYGPLGLLTGNKPSPEEAKERRQRARIILEEARAARLWRALYSPRQLHEVMVDFWYNHFNVFAFKALDHLWIGAYEAEAIRPHALGRFRDLLGATAHHPAMLFYLDNVQNSAPGSKGPGGREIGLNENYARELMELHTLGADGGYTQDDVVALARILTGWSLARPRALPPQGSGFAFYPVRHDTGEKRLLGRAIAANGEAEGEAALDLLAQHPATARRIAVKLAQYFVADAPPAPLVDRLAARFRDSDGDIRAVLRALFASREFRDSAGGKYKSPYRYVLSAARAAGVEVNNPRPLLNAMARQGQPLYGCATPDGYRDTEEAWLSPDASLLRVSFATALAAGKLPLQAAADAAPMAAEQPMAEMSAGEKPATVGKAVDAAPVERLLGPLLGQETRAALAEAPPDLRTALLLGSPDFMRR